MATERDEKDQRLEELGEDIARTRQQAEEHGTLPPEEPEQTFIDPDADGRIDDDDEHPGTSFAT